MHRESRTLNAAALPAAMGDMLSLYETISSYSGQNSQEEGIEDGDAKKGLIESGILHNLACSPALVKDPLPERTKFSLKLGWQHALIYALQMITMQADSVSVMAGR